MASRSRWAIAMII